MHKQVNIYLVIGALLSGIAAVLHIFMILGGPEWYRFFGAGERFANAVAQGRYLPIAITVCITVVLCIWSAYALSGAGAIRALPFLKPALLGITAIYLIRAIVFAPAVLTTGGQLTPFMFWSSAICLGFGIVHLIGLVQRWSAL